MNSTIVQKSVLVLLAMAGVMTGCNNVTEAQAGNTQRERRMPVTVAEVREHEFEERLTVQGNLLAKNYAMVSPLVDGQVTDVFVEEGDRVTARETALMQTDKVALTQAYEIALQDKVVAQHAQRDAEAQLLAAEAQYEKAEIDFHRFKRLREQQAVTPDALEQVEAGYKVARAQYERAQTAVTLRQEQTKQAEAALIIAKKILDDSLLISPIDGWVSFRTVKPGEFAGAGTPAFRIVDTGLLEVSAFLPGEHYPRIQTGETRIRVRVGGIDTGRHTITFKSPEIQDQLRTFEVKALIEDPLEGVVPGAIAQIDTTLLTRTSPGVPRDVIQVRDGKTVVFTVDEDTAHMVEVETGLTTDGWTEITDGSLPVGTRIITRGYNLVNDGSPVDVQREE